MTERLSRQPPARWRIFGLVSAIVLLLQILLPLRGSHPNLISFDETFYGPVIEESLCNHRAITISHPPWGTMITTYFLKLAGFPCGVQNWRSSSPLSLDPLTFRFVAKGTWILCIALAIATTFYLSRSRLLSLILGVFMALESGFFIHSQMLSIDSLLALFILAASLCSLVATRAPSSVRSWLWIGLAGVFCGLATGVKWTGGTAIFVALGVFVAFRTPTHSMRWVIGATVAVVLISLAVYLSGWWVHRSVTWAPGDEDPIREISKNFFDYAWRMHVLFWKTQIAIGTYIPSQESSSWWMWPWGWRPILYSTNENHVSLLLVNPVIWTGGAILMVRRLVALAKGPRAKWGDFSDLEKFAMIGWLGCYLPHILVPRNMFLYHYFPALIFSILLIVGSLCPKKLALSSLDGGPTLVPSPRRLTGWLVPAALWFVCVAPIVYGLELPAQLVSLLQKVFWKVTF